MKMPELIKFPSQAAQVMKAILDSMIQLVVYMDLEDRIIWANKAACKSVGLALEDIADKYCYEVWYKRKEPCDN